MCSPSTAVATSSLAEEFVSALVADGLLIDDGRPWRVRQERRIRGHRARASMRSSRKRRRTCAPRWFAFHPSSRAR